MTSSKLRVGLNTTIRKRHYLELLKRKISRSSRVPGGKRHWCVRITRHRECYSFFALYSILCVIRLYLQPIVRNNGRSCDIDTDTSKREEKRVSSTAKIRKLRYRREHYGPLEDTLHCLSDKKKVGGLK